MAILRSMQDVRSFKNQTNNLLTKNFDAVMTIAKDVQKMHEDIPDANEQLRVLKGHVLAFARRELEVKSYCRAAEQV